MPGPQKSMPQFRDDQLACQDFAQASLGGWTPNDAAANSAAASAAVGTLLGAAAGAILGSVSGQAGQGAAWGAGTGLLFGSAAGVNAAGYSQQETQRRYDVAYVQCMWSRGNSVPGPVAFRAGPSQAAPAIPPPNTPPPAGLASGAPSSRIPAPPMTPPRGTIAPPGTAPGVPPGAIAPGTAGERGAAGGFSAARHSAAQYAAAARLELTRGAAHRCAAGYRPSLSAMPAPIVVCFQL